MNKSRNIIKLKFPVGKFRRPEIIKPDEIKEWILEIELFPSRIKDLVNGLSKNELNWRYRPEGWTIQQLVHHCADSHINSYIRFKLSLTEDTPTIKPYFQDKWARLADTTKSSISESIKIIEGLHARWVQLLRSLKAEDLKKEFIHPEYGKRFSLAENIGIYAWHCNHHLAHIKLALESKMK